MKPPPEQEFTGMEPITWMELMVSYMLRAGVLLSSAIIAVGIVWLAVTHSTGYSPVLPHHLPDILAYHQRGGPGAFPKSSRAVWTGVRRVKPKPYAIIGLGILLLIATPVLRVALSVMFFLVQEDWLYVGITLVVLTVLLGSLLTGIG